MDGRHLNDPATGKPRLLTEQCATCPGRPGNITGLRPGRRREVINGNRDGLGLICHETIDYSTSGGGTELAFCRWFYDKITSNYQRLCERLGGFCEVPPPPDPRTASTGGARARWAQPPDDQEKDTMDTRKIRLALAPARDKGRIAEEQQRDDTELANARAEHGQAARQDRLGRSQARRRWAGPADDG